MTIREILNAQKGYIDRETHRYRAEWERARWMAAVMVSPYSKGNKKIKPSDIVTFPWEKEGEGSVNDEIKKIQEYRELIKKGNGK